MLKQFFLVLILVFIIVPYVSGYETLNAVFVDGEISMIMDGSLDDWADIPAQEVTVTHSVEKTREDAEVISTQGVSDCQFTFKCFADKKHVYFALIVKDDEVLIGRHEFGKGWLDDSNTLYFDGDCIDVNKDYYDANDGQLKVIGNPPNGVKYIEGLVPYFKNLTIPYFWEARGVKSGFSLTEDGYITELALPASLLGWTDIAPGRIMGANLRVVDKDGDADEDNTDKGYIWAPDPDHTAHYSARSFNRILFSTVVPAPESSSQTTQISINEEGMNAVLGAPDFTAGEILINAVLADLEKDDFISAEAKLIPEQDKLWVKPLLGVIQLRKNDIENGANNIFTFGTECPERLGEDWVVKYLMNETEYILQYKNDVALNDLRVKNNIFLILEKFANFYPDIVEAWMNAGEWAQDSRNYSKAIDMFTKAEEFNDINTVYEAKLGKARNLFLVGNYDQSEQEVQRIIDSNADTSIKYDAELLLMSIDRKQ